MALPNPAMTFSPFAILTAEEMNDISENIDALATGSGLNDGSITNVKLSTASGELGGPWQTWSPTIGGFSAAPANGVYRYKKVGNTIFIMIRQPSSGTSNATTFTFTLPAIGTSANITNAIWETACRAENAGTIAGTRRATIGANSNTLTINISDTTDNGWTASGQKRVISLEMFYEVA